MLKLWGCEVMVPAGRVLSRKRHAKRRLQEHALELMLQPPSAHQPVVLGATNTSVLWLSRLQRHW